MVARRRRSRAGAGVAGASRFRGPGVGGFFNTPRGTQVATRWRTELGLCVTSDEARSLHQSTQADLCGPRAAGRTPHRYTSRCLSSRGRQRLSPSKGMPPSTGDAKGASHAFTERALPQLRGLPVAAPPPPPHTHTTTRFYSSRGQCFWIHSLYLVQAASRDPSACESAMTSSPCTSTTRMPMSTGVPGGKRGPAATAAL